MKKFVLLGSLLLIVWIFIYPAYPVYQIKIPSSRQKILETEFMRFQDENISLNHKNTWRILSEVSPSLTCAVIKAEDRMFFRHKGFDWRQIRRAIGKAFFNSIKMGASTISQQVARNLFLTSKKTFVRKIREAIYTFWLERFLSKDQILSIYLNQIEWGKGVWGINQASQFYFQKDPKDLFLEESYFLASLIANPLEEIKGFQLQRMEVIYDRINNQFLMSRLISEKVWQKAARSWLIFSNDAKSGRSSRGIFSKSRDQPLSFLEVKEECGLNYELQNWLQ